MAAAAGSITPEPAPPKPSHRIRNVSIVVAVAAVAVVAALAFIPVSHSFSFVVSTNGAVSRSYPSGAQVTVYWDTSKTGGNSGLQVTEGAGAVLYDQQGAGGTFSFVASGGTYDFSVSLLDWPANVWGNWGAPTI